jgi:predicted nucleic acid-binding protein
MSKLKIYMDCCCFCRPFDDLSQHKVSFEREAVLSIINSCESGLWDIFRSDVLEDEILKIVNPIKQQKVLMLYSSATLNIEINDEIISRAASLIDIYNLGAFDAVHLASAEYGEADILLTTDKKFYNRAIKSDIKIKIANPAFWLTEVFINE